MNRSVMWVVVGLLTTGCAAGVEDPQPAPEEPAPQKAPPSETFSGSLEQADPYATIDKGLNIPKVPQFRAGPVPIDRGK
jgi:hypothetical protein